MRVYWNCTLCCLMVKTAMPSRNLPKGWLAGTLYNTHWVLPSSFRHTSVLLLKKVLVPTTGPPSQPCPNLPPQTKRGENCQGPHKSQDQRAGPLQNERNKYKPSLNSRPKRIQGPFTSAQLIPQQSHSPVPNPMHTPTRPPPPNPRMATRAAS